MEYTQEKLIEAGGNLWENYGKKRVYFEVNDYIDFEAEFYGTGNISSCKLYGEHLSNGKGTKVLYALGDAKLFYDLVTKELVCNIREPRGFDLKDEILDNLKKKLENK